MEPQRPSWLDAGLRYLYGVNSGDAALNHRQLSMGNGLVSDWLQTTVYIYDDLMYSLESDNICGFEIAVCVIYEFHMEAYIARWLDAGLQYLQCVSN